MANTGNVKYSGNSGGRLDSEAQLWAAADKLRGHMDASEYKHVCLGLHRHESRTLAGLRDALLPELLSGGLRVPAASGSMEARA